MFQTALPPLYLQSVSFQLTLWAFHVELFLLPLVLSSLHLELLVFQSVLSSFHLELLAFQMKLPTFHLDLVAFQLAMSNEATSNCKSFIEPIRVAPTRNQFHVVLAAVPYGRGSRAGLGPIWGSRMDY